MIQDGGMYSVSTLAFSPLPLTAFGRCSAMVSDFSETHCMNARYGKTEQQKIWATTQLVVLMVLLAARVVLAIYYFYLIYSVTLSRLVSQFLSWISARSCGVFVEPATAFNKAFRYLGVNNVLEDWHVTPYVCWYTRNTNRYEYTSISVSILGWMQHTDKIRVLLTRRTIY